MVRISLLVICSVTSKLVFECLNVLAPLPLCGNIKNLQRWCRSTGAASSGNCKGEIAKCVGERHMFDNTNQKHSHTLSSALSVKDLTFPFKSLFWNLWLQAQKTVCRSLFALHWLPDHLANFTTFKGTVQSKVKNTNMYFRFTFESLTVGGEWDYMWF